MKIDKKVAIIILVIFSIILAIILFSKTFSYSETILSIIRWAFLILSIIPWLVLSVPAFLPRTRKSKFFSNSGYFVVIYYGILLMLFSINKDLLTTEVPLFNNNSFVLGIAIVALGWSLLPKKLREPEVTENLEKSETDNLNEKLAELDERFDKMENIISSTFFELGEKLEKIQKKKDKQ